MPAREIATRVAVEQTWLDATVVAPERALPGALFIHGWGGGQKQYLGRAREVAALGCVCMTFDLRGHARDESMMSHVSREQNLADVVAAFDYLKSLPGVNADQIGVVGSSYGGYLAAILTESRDVRWLALRAPALYQDDGWLTPKLQLHRDQDLPVYRRRSLTPADNRALRACAAYHGDVLIVASEHDRTIPPEVVTSYQKACTAARSLTYWVLGAADHGLSDPAWQLEYTGMLTKWLAQVSFGRRQKNEPPAHVAGVPEIAPQVIVR